ncbi:hypothetical protein BDY21DRAFT_79761 [Lineolata rhizophorae]|uniref:NDT80 domain-containing protein n=1 Tax=Lineolata rhizophorae TaxID=578093 RepID=A0A6A6NU98_9PEZI|nr:hypothetical protein BDY21DRAFT_79761 [Lineolata rhizophorae]
MHQTVQRSFENFSLPPESEFVDHIGSNAHHTSFTGSAATGPESELGQSAHSMLSMPSTHYLPHRAETGDNQPAIRYHSTSSISDSGSGSISTSPSSNNSQVACPPFHLPNAYSSGGSSVVPNPYPSSHLYQGSAGYSSWSGGSISSVRPRMTSMTDSSAPEMRSPGINSTVSPSFGAAGSIREAYSTTTPHTGRHAHNLPVSPRNHSGALPRAYTETPRAPLPVTMGTLPAPAGQYAAAYGSSYLHPDSRPAGTPPFSDQRVFHDISYEGSSVKPQIEAKIEKGFFYSADQIWTCYRRNYFSVQCSYTLNPQCAGSRLYLNRSKDRPEQIQAIAMSLSAAVDGAQGKTIELVQHTPKRDKGPQLQIKKEKLFPMPANKPHPEPYGMPPYHHPVVSTAPVLPLQGEACDNDQVPGYAMPQNSAANYQHTFERIQFKSATANNGKRRAQQQYYHLIVELWVDVRRSASEPETDKTWVKIAERASDRVVVRGRSPSHYQNEGPHNPAGGARGNPGNPGAGAGGHHYGANNGVRGLGSFSTLNNMHGGYSRGSHHHYAMDPSPGGSHSVSSSSSISGGPGEPVSLEGHLDDERKSLEGCDGYQYCPAPLEDAGYGHRDTKPSIQVTLPPFDDGKSSKEGYAPPQLSNSNWMTGSCAPGRFQLTDSSKGYYPHQSY